MRILLTKKAAVILMSSLIMMAGCLDKRTLERLSGNSGSPSTQKVITGSGGKIQVTVPGNWREDRALNESAELQASSRAEEMYIVVIADTKADFSAMTLEEHSKLTRENITEAMGSPQVSRIGPLNINGNQAVQYEIRGIVDKLNVVYLHTTVETANNFHQILSWTLPSRYDKNKSTLQGVIQSFKETSVK